MYDVCFKLFSLIFKIFARKLIRISKKDRAATENEVEVISVLIDKDKHDNIVHILNHEWLFDAKEMYFIDMKLVELTLRNYIDYLLDKNGETKSSLHEIHSQIVWKSSSKLQILANACEIESQIALELYFLHTHEIIHKDLKSNNDTIFKTNKC